MSSQPKAHKPLTRLGGPVPDPDLIFPPLDKFYPANKLPTIGSVLSFFKFCQKEKGSKYYISTKKVIKEDAKQIYAKYYHAVYCVSMRTIERRVEQLWKTYCESVKRLQENGKEHRNAVNKYKELVELKDTLFDVSATDENTKKACEIQWGLSMGPREIAYLV